MWPQIYTHLKSSIKYLFLAAKDDMQSSSYSLQPPHYSSISNTQQISTGNYRTTIIHTRAFIPQYFETWLENPHKFAETLQAPGLHFLALDTIWFIILISRHKWSSLLFLLSEHIANSVHEGKTKVSLFFVYSNNRDRYIAITSLG